MGVVAPSLAVLAGQPADRQAGDRDPVASEGLAPVLDLEVTEPAREASPGRRGPPTDRNHVSR